MTDLNQFLIEQQSTISDAMKKIDNIYGCAVYVVDNKKPIASITDGDVRRYLLSGGNVENVVLNAANKNLKFLYKKELPLAQEKIKELSIDSIPIVNEDGTLYSIVFSSGKAINEKLDVPVVINAGGKGTRLYPYTKILPKPLIPVGDLPVIDHIINQFAQYQCPQYYIIVNHKKSMIKAYFSESHIETAVQFLDEEKPLGTGGGLSLLKGHISQPFFLTNCDIIVKADYADILKFHTENKNSITMVCAYKHFKIPYGVITMGEKGSIHKFEEKPEYNFLTNTGLYLVNPEVIDDLTDDEVISFPDIMLNQEKKGRVIAVYPVSERSWLDMGELDELENMRKELGV